MPTHIVGPEESVPSIARDYGFFWTTIWDHPDNSEIKSLRKNPNVMYEGDELFVPELRAREETRATDEKHKFRRKGVPVKLKLRLLKMDKPRANEAYVLEFKDQRIEGKTDGDGVLEHYVPNDAHEAHLSLGTEKYTIEIGTLNPVDEVTGVQQRLNNLGFDCGDEFGFVGEQTRQALKSFQAQNKLEVSGKIDDATKSKLNELHQ